MQVIPVGRHAFVHLIDVVLDSALPCDTRIDYDLLIDGHSPIAEWAPHLLYGNAGCPNLVVRSRIDQLLHGSCRKPHHPAADGLLCVDQLLSGETDPQQRPALLMMSGDQIYADDVSGPMLRAIHCLIERLGLFDEHLEGAVVSDSASSTNTRPATTTARICYRRWRVTRPCASVFSAVRANRFSPAAAPTITW